ncbi:phenoloxidase 2 [Frankliniella occidentalis]|uniref:Phenoloxidase 2 n=1 Tax=Frankliniella occidentalis TaxID=133901 RepID=A0A6J1SG99_FRAOC|nr:phenoloxidase 2 [Frankliniella occidentalis]
MHAIACLSVAVLASLALVVPSTEAQANVAQLQYLFDRPSEPIFLPKESDRGDKKVVFDVPREYLTDRQKKLSTQVINRFGEKAERISVRKITLPDLSIPGQLDRRAQFSLFLPEHRKLASRLINIFMGMRNLDDFLSAAVYARSHLNPYLFVYAYSVALLHRDDTRNAHLPPLAELFPEKYVNGDLFARAREETNTVLDPQQRLPIIIPKDYTASDLEEEHKVAYFREDLGINLHHWHWHLVYPFDAPIEIVRKDRRGELFYYMHQQVLARYNMERFSNGLQRVKRLIDLREPIAEGYFPKLDSLVSSRVWPARASNTRLSDISRDGDQIKFDLQDIERWRDRIYEAIHSGAVTTDQGRRQNLTEFGGVDVLGNIIESSIISPNRALYGDMHNFGHIAIAFSHDPDNRHLESFGVMGDSTTAMRDPVFYRWHAFVDDIFQEHKRTLPAYTQQQLDFPGVQVKGLEVNTPGARRPNEFFTFLQQNDMDLSRGLDFTPRGPVFARFTHLQHRPFTYKITVENNAPGQRMGYVRIFLGPKFDERGTPMLFRDQRTFMVELDKFPINLSQRTNTIERRSTMSSVTIPFERTFRNLDQNRPGAGDQLEQFNFCGCGWPQHMLIPRGSPQGLQAQLFVMITDYSQDKVDQPLEGMCNDASSYCGVRGQRYPDLRPMGFPFDRSARQGVDQLRSFLTRNMFIQDVVIKFQGDRVEAPASRNATTFNG